MDFSVSKEFQDLKDTERKIFDTLRREFRSIGYEILDEKFEIKPKKSGPDKPEWWGGYMVEFKLVEQSLFQKLKGDVDALRRQSEVLGPLEKRVYSIDISQNEFCEGKVKRQVDDYVVYVYSLEMIAAEKLRAICQQMPAYKYGLKKPRARDFYDIHQIINENGIDLTSDANRATIAAQRFQETEKLSTIISILCPKLASDLEALRKK